MNNDERPYATKISNGDEESPYRNQHCDGSPTERAAAGENQNMMESDEDKNNVAAQEQQQTSSSRPKKKKLWMHVVAWIIGGIVGFLLVSFFTSSIDLLPNSGEEDEASSADPQSSSPYPANTPKPTSSPLFWPVSFSSRPELDKALRAYRLDELMLQDTEYINVSQKYGHPIGTRKVGQITDFSHLFEGLSFNEDIGDWETSLVR